MLRGPMALLRVAASAALLLHTSAAQWQPEALPVTMPTKPYELLDYDAVAAASQVVTTVHARFTVFTERFIRMEYRAAAATPFEDRPTLGFLNRKAEAPAKFTHRSIAGGGVTIETDKITLTYSGGGGPFSAANLKVTTKTPAAPGFKDWAPGMANDGNLLGTIKSLDEIGPTPLNCTINAAMRLGPNPSADKGPGMVHSERLHCTWGLISRDGWSIYDDSDSPVLDETGWWGTASADKKDTTFVNNSNSMDWCGQPTLCQSAITLSPFRVANPKRELAAVAESREQRMQRMTGIGQWPGTASSTGTTTRAR